MKYQQIRAEVLSGHKEDAVEVPFDPTALWKIAPKPLRPGRRGHRVSCRLKELEFESAIVPRSRRFYLLLRDEICRAAAISTGDRVVISVSPLEETHAVPTKTKTARRRSRH